MQILYSEQLWLADYYVIHTRKSHIYEIEFVEELDALLEKKEYSDIYEFLEYVRTVENSIEVQKLIHRYSNDAQRLCKYFKNDAITTKG